MGNLEKNKYVKDQLTNTLIELLYDKELNKISISELVDKSHVGRSSFYRNYENMENIIKDYIESLLLSWQKEYDIKYGITCSKDINHMFGSLFEHFKEYSSFYMMIYERGLLYLLLNSIKSICGPKIELSNSEAYLAAFISYGLFGWIEEWFVRGMTEYDETMSLLLRSLPTDTKK